MQSGEVNRRTVEPASAVPSMVGARLVPGDAGVVPVNTGAAGPEGPAPLLLDCAALLDGGALLDGSPLVGGVLLDCGALPDGDALLDCGELLDSGALLAGGALLEESGVPLLPGPLDARRDDGREVLEDGGVETRDDPSEE